MKNVCITLTLILLTTLAVQAQTAYVNPEAHFQRGIERYQRGDLSGAREDFERVIAIDPRSAEGYYNRGVVFYDQKDFEKAREDFGRAIALNPKYTMAYLKRGNLNLGQEAFDAPWQITIRPCSLNQRTPWPGTIAGWSIKPYVSLNQRCMTLTKPSNTTRR